MTFNPTQAAGATPVTAATDGNPLSGISCLSATSCVAMDRDGSSWDGDPTSSAAWTPSIVNAGDDLTSVFCRSAQQCVTVDAGGRAFVRGAKVTLSRLPQPSVTHLKQSASVWHESTSLPSLALGHLLRPARRVVGGRKTGIGTTFSFHLNEPAIATFIFMQRRTHKRDTLRQPAKAGRNKLHFYSRTSPSQRLKPGPYTLRVEATNVRGRTAFSPKLNFRILR